MASLKKRPDGSWRARYRVEGGREIARHFPTRREAEHWLQREGAARQSGTWVDPKHGKVTLRDYAEGWQKVQAWRPSTAAKVESQFRLHVYPVLGRRPLVQIRTSELQAWVRGLALADSTKTNLAHVLGQMFRDAVRDRLIPTTPSVGVRTPRLERAVVVPLAPVQVAALLDATPDRWRALIALGAGCGLRIGEATGLDVAGVDFLRRRVRVRRQLLTPDKGHAWAVGPPKTMASSREVPLPRPVALELAAHLERWPEVDHGFARLIFTTVQGNPPRRQHASDVVTRAVKRAGLPEGTTFHDLRHHYASLLIASGLSVKAVQSALGHATAAETLDTYGHLWPAEADALAGAVETAWHAKEPPARGEGLG